MCRCARSTCRSSCRSSPTTSSDARAAARRGRAWPSWAPGKPRPLLSHAACDPEAWLAHGHCVDGRRQPGRGLLAQGASGRPARARVRDARGPGGRGTGSGAGRRAFYRGPELEEGPRLRHARTDQERPCGRCKGAPAGVSVVVVGLNHRTVPLEMLERMNVSPARLPKVLGDLAAREHIGEVVVLSTCHRTEVYAVAERYHGAVQDIRHAFSELAFIPPEDFSDHLYTYFDDGAVNHLFSVAAGLDSVVLGESEILGQVRQAWQAAYEEGAAGPRLAALFRHAVVAGKRVRTETAIGRGSTSLAHAAVDMAARRLGSLEGKRILLLGAGDVGESMARAVSGIAGAQVFIANRTWDRAVALAARVGGRAVQLDGLAAALGEADVLMTSTGAPSAIVDHSDLAPVIERRGGRPLLIVDVAMPRDIDAAVAAPH